MTNELVVIDQATALDLFTAPDKVQQLIERIKQKSNEERIGLSTDVSVAKNRKALASLAYKVTQTKTYIDKSGKQVVDELKALPKKVDAARKLFRDELDALSDEIRQPVTEWEEAEKSRIEAEALAKRIALDYEDALQMNELYDLRKAEEERKRKEHEEELKRQAAEQARIEAEQKAQREIEEARQATERAEREKQEAIEQALREAKEAQERAEREKQAAVEAERRKLEEEEKTRLAEIERQKQEEPNRQADKSHRAAINNQAMQDLITAGIPEEHAKACVIAIAQGSVKNIKITY